MYVRTYGGLTALTASSRALGLVPLLFVRYQRYLFSSPHLFLSPPLVCVQWLTDGSATLQQHCAKVDGEKAAWLVHFRYSAHVCSMLYRTQVDCSSRWEWMDHKKADT